MKRTLTLVIGILAALLIVAGCDTGTNTPPTTPPTTEPPTPPAVDPSPPAVEPAPIETPPAVVPTPTEPSTPPTPAVTTMYAAKLTATNQVPPLSSAALGDVSATLDGSTLALTGTFTGLGSPVTMSHIHLGGMTENGAVLVPIQVSVDESGSSSLSGTSGTLSLTTTLDSAQLAQLNNGLLYVNVHTSDYPDGEIRGQLLPEGSPGLTQKSTADTTTDTAGSGSGIPMQTTGSSTTGSSSGSTGGLY